MTFPIANLKICCQLVDTKSVNNTTLLHFLEKTVSKHFPDIEEFLDELERPAEAYRGEYTQKNIALWLNMLLVNLQDVRKGLSELQEGLGHIRRELDLHFSDLKADDQFATQMWAFIGKAKGQLEDLVDDVRSAEATFVEAIGYYGEENKNMSTSEFYGIFKIFVTSYRARAIFIQTITLLTVFARNVNQIIKLPSKRNWQLRNASKRWKRTECNA